MAEEVKTAHEGEVIGPFIEEKIERGLSLGETIAETHGRAGSSTSPTRSTGCAPSRTTSIR